jgi:hypothetical protein
MRGALRAASLVLVFAAPASANDVGGSDAMWWVGAGTLVFAAGLIVLFGIRQGYDAPRQLDANVAATAPPDSLPPGLAGVLAARGRPSLEHAAATILALADRGVLRVDESASRTLGTRTYHLTRTVDRATFAPHEQAVLATVYRRPQERTVTLARARQRLVGRLRGFTRAVIEQLDAAGLIDRERQRVRRAYLRVMVTELGLTLTALALWPFLIATDRAWPLAIVVGLAAASAVALLAYVTTTPLTNEGVERGRQWRAYRSHLRALARHDTAGSDSISSAYIVALGLASEWSKRLKRHPSAAPSWFRSEDGSTAYPLFIAAAGAGAHGNSPPHHAH